MAAAAIIDLKLRSVKSMRYIVESAALQYALHDVITDCLSQLAVHPVPSQ